MHNKEPFIDILSSAEAKEYTAFLPPVKKRWWTKTTVWEEEKKVYAVYNNAGDVFECDPKKELCVRLVVRNIVLDERKTFVLNGHEFVSLGNPKNRDGGYLAVSKRPVTVHEFDKNGSAIYPASSLCRYVKTFESKSLNELNALAEKYN